MREVLRMWTDFFKNVRPAAQTRPSSDSPAARYPRPSARKLHNQPVDLAFHRFYRQSRHRAYMRQTRGRALAAATGRRKIDAGRHEEVHGRLMANPSPVVGLAR
jgi:hypothetical protein